MNKEIKISRSDLIAKCDQYLNGEIQEKDFEDYAWSLITEEHFDWNDDLIPLPPIKVKNPQCCRQKNSCQ